MEDFVIHKILYSDIEIQYEELYREIFKNYDYLQIPSYVYIGFYKGEYVGFISTYLHNIDTIYMEYSGFIDKFKGYKALGFFRHALDFIHKDYSCILCRIERDNIPSLKVALSTGFKIEGLHVRDKTWVDMIKVKYMEDKENG